MTQLRHRYALAECCETRILKSRWPIGVLQPRSVSSSRTGMRYSRTGTALAGRRKDPHRYPDLYGLKWSAQWLRTAVVTLSRRLSWSRPELPLPSLSSPERLAPLPRRRPPPQMSRPLRQPHRQTARLVRRWPGSRLRTRRCLRRSPTSAGNSDVVARKTLNVRAATAWCATGRGSAIRRGDLP